MQDVVLAVEQSIRRRRDADRRAHEERPFPAIPPGYTNVAGRRLWRVDPHGDSGDLQFRRLVCIVTRPEAHGPQGQLLEGDGSPQADQSVNHGIHGTVSAGSNECADSVVERGANRPVIAARLSLYDPRVEHRVDVRLDRGISCVAPSAPRIRIQKNERSSSR
jgi:hypothetical protein